jgi:hypothetical protein
MKVLADGTVVMVSNFSETARPKEKVQFESSQEMKDYLNDILAYANKQVRSLNAANHFATSVMSVVATLRSAGDPTSTALANLLDDAVGTYQGSLLDMGDTVN